MLRQLTINNIALIDSITVEFHEGLNILTGETGAGKSIIIDSINAILGERVSRDVIRTGSDRASVEAVFYTCSKNVTDKLEQLGIEPEDDGTLILFREFTVSGKNICRVNNRMVTTSVLKELGELLIDIHGQHDNQSLFNISFHIELLDSFGGHEIGRIKAEYASKFSEYKKVKADISRICIDTAERDKKKDFLEYQISEISSAELKPGEEEELLRKKNILSNSQKIIRVLENSYGLLTAGSDTRGSLIDNLFMSQKEISELSSIDGRYAAISESLETISYQLEEISREIRDLMDDVEYDPAMMEEIAERLDAITRLKRKYGASVEEVLENYSSMQKQLQELVNNDEILEGLRASEKKLSDELFELSARLSEKRRDAARLLEGSICKVLEELEMKNSIFKADIQFNDMKNAQGDYDFNETGLDRVEFLISTNKGEPLKSLSKIASGGEISRVMLAIKTILAKVDNIPVLIFDEIDNGISGKAAQQVGAKMSVLSKDHQVICVTHLAQIACMAHSHYLISKASDGNQTRTKVENLDDDSRVKEIARILSGTNITDLTIKHASEMIDFAKKYTDIVNSEM